MMRLALKFVFSFAVAMTVSNQLLAESRFSSNCGDDSCTVGFQLNTADTGQRLATYQATIFDNQDGGRLSVIVPLGSAIEPGVKVVFGEIVYILPIIGCFPDGCTAVVQLEPAEFDAVLDQDSIDLQFFSLAKDVPLGALVSLEGFKEEVAELREARSQQ